MSNNAMSNETDLDWLARETEGEWFGNSTHIARDGLSDYLWANEPRLPHCRGRHRYHWFTKAQYLERKAELQNKPSWDDFGESAKFMAQDSDGAWMAFESEPAANYHVWSSMRGWCGYAREGRDRCRGEVLGDWRETL